MTSSRADPFMITKFRKYTWLMLFLGMNGCAWNDNFAAKGLWLSPSTDLHEKIEAANKLLPKDASPKQVKQVLGPSGIWRHDSGYAVDLYSLWEQTYGSSTNIRDQALTNSSRFVEPKCFDLYYLEYPATNGYITVIFEPPTNSLCDYQYKRVSYILTNLPGDARFVNLAPK